MLTFLIALTAAVPALPQEPRATIRVEVRTDSTPIAGAIVTLNGVSIEADRNGAAIGSVALGKVDVRVTKQGFLPGATSLTVDEALESQAAMDLQPDPPQEP